MAWFATASVCRKAASQYSRTSLIRSCYVRFCSANVCDRKHKKILNTITFFYWSIRFLKTNLSAPTFSTWPNCDCISFAATGSHVNKKSMRLENISCPPQQLPRNIHPLVSHENAGAHCFIFWYHQNLPWPSHATFTAIAANPITISVFTYLFHSAWGVVPLEVHCPLLIGDNPNAPTVVPCCRWRNVSVMFRSGDIFRYRPPA